MATGFNTQVGNGEYRLQFETDNKEHYLLMQEAARRCVDGKSKTNADRIRSMSDEELLDFICSIETYDEGSVKTIEGGSALCSVTDVEKWLQSEVEE